MHAMIRQYMELVKFLGGALGPDYEVTLHDLSSDDKSIVAIVNGQISGRSIGAPLTDLALQFIKDKVYEHTDYQLNYRGVSKKNPFIRSSTMFIKDKDKRLIGMLCINYDASRGVDLLQELGTLLRLPLPTISQPPEEVSPALPQVQDSIETFSNSITDVVGNALLSVLGDASFPKERLTQEEKVEVVDLLNQKGVFLLKGAVSEVAQQLCSSEASIYRYLSKLNREGR